MRQKTIIEVVYLHDNQRHIMTYITSYPEEARRFYNYYRPKIGDGTYVSIKSKKFFA